MLLTYFGGVKQVGLRVFIGGDGWIYVPQNSMEVWGLKFLRVLMMPNLINSVGEF